MADFEFGAAYDGLADAIIAADAGGRVVYANPAAHELLGWPSGQLVGEPLTAMMPLRMRPMHQTGFARYMTTGEARLMRRPTRVPALRRDGSEVDVELTLSPLAGIGGARVVASLRDLRDRVELERQVLAQQRLAAHNAVMRVFADAASVDEAAPRVLAAIGDTLQWALGNFWVVDGGTLRWLAGWQAPRMHDGAFLARSRETTFAAGVGLPGRVWATSQPSWIVDVAEDASFPRRQEAAGAGLHGAFAFPVAMRNATVGVVELFAQAPQKVDAELLETARTIGMQIGHFVERIEATRQDESARRRAEDAEQRARFLAEAGAALAESLDYERTLRRVAELAVPRVADWCTVSALDARGRLERVAVVHHDPAKASLVEAYRTSHPPGEHRAGELMAVIKRGEPVFQPNITDAELRAAAQDDAHLAILRGLGCTSCIMAPMSVRGSALGIVSFMRADPARPFVAADLELIKQLAERAAIAVDNAQLYQDARRKQEVTRFLAEASTLLSSSLDYDATFQRLAQLVVPRFGDWCSVEVLENGVQRQVAVAHVDPAKIELARELQRRYPVDPTSPTGVPNVIRTGRSELYEDIPDELLVLSTRDPEHLRMARELGLRSAVIVPLVVRDQVLGGLSLVWAESGRHYSKDDLPLLEDLGRRAGLAVDNARLYREAQDAIKLRDEFLSIASHELKTPLTSLQLQVSGMQRNIKLGRPDHLTPERLGSGVDRIDRHVNRLGKLVEDLLDVSRASAGQLRLELADVELSEVVRDVATRFEDDVTNAGCSLTLRIDGPLVGCWDRTRLDQIVTNFVSNAIKYGPHKPIEIELRRDGERALLSVRDHGIGIAPADQRRIFERYARAVSPEHYGGLGLGLWIVRVLVEAMKGTVAVESEPGVGSTFTVTLPLRAN